MMWLERFTTGHPQLRAALRALLGIRHFNHGWTAH